MTANIAADFERGMNVAADEDNAVGIRAGGEAVTTLRSAWLFRTCPRCWHTFRLGDHVEIVEGEPVRHHASDCQSGDPEDEKSAISSRFFLGLDEEWPPPRETPLVRLELGHSLLAPPSKGFRRHTCVVCGHTLRRYDSVVICPCSPLNPACGVAIHRDPVHGLHCWDSWAAGRTTHVCPITMREAR